MSSCAVKRGIITLRDCRNPVTGTCAQCSRSICTEHTTTGEAGVICVECRARNVEQTQSGSGKGIKALSGKKQKATDPGVDRYQDDDWPYQYRNYYYTTSLYSPFYSGHYYDSYYDSYDVRSLDATGIEGEVGEDSGEAGGFYDS